MQRWRGYWFAPGGRTSAAIVRVAIATSVLWTLLRTLSAGYAANPAHSPLELYHPVGLWMLAGSAPPPAWLVELLAPVAWVTTAAMLLGVKTRLSTVASWLSAVALVSYDVSFTPSWPHHNNLPFLAQLAFFGARGGDVWSVDAWLRRRRGLPALEVAAGYQWSLRLVQLAVALMFFAAAMAKLFFGHFTLAWAFSDNLRHQLLARFDWIGVPRTAVASWLIDDVWRYRAAALLNLLAQMTPITSVALVRRPRLRLLAGGMFVIEVLALGLVMDLWNVHWLPLAAVFVDWDYWLGARARSSTPAHHPEPNSRPPHAAAISAFVALYLLYDLVVAFGLDQRLRTYPFSAYPMFGYVRAKRPYDRHATYEMPGAVIEVLAQVPLSPFDQVRVDSHYTFRTAYKVRSADKLEAQLSALHDTLLTMFPERGVEGVRLHLASFQAPAYPAPASLQPRRLGVLGERRGDQVRSALGTVRAEGGLLRVTPRWRGLSPRVVTYQAVIDYAPELVPLVEEPGADSDAGTVVLRRPKGASVVVLAVADGVAYVVGESGKRRW